MKDTGGSEENIRVLPVGVEPMTVRLLVQMLYRGATGESWELRLLNKLGSNKYWQKGNDRQETLSFSFSKPALKRWSSIFWRTVKKEQELSRNAKMIFGEVNLTVTIFIFVVRPKAKCTRWSLVRKRFLFTVTWATLDAEMEGGRWPWKLMAQR